MVFDWITFLFIDEESAEECPTHNFKKVKFVSKLNGKTISKGVICTTCEMRLMEYQKIIIRTNEKWIPIKEYMTQQGIISATV
jgi:hypothetical protein